MKRYIVDTGPVIALLNAADSNHKWARETFDRIEPALITCEPVLAEACYLANRLKGGADKVLDLVGRDIVRVSFDLGTEIEAIRSLMARYASVPMSLADACLVRMTELDDQATIVSLDSDFRVYRRHRRQAVPVLLPK
jgi:uncharacterized protein